MTALLFTFICLACGINENNPSNDVVNVPNQNINIANIETGNNNLITIGNCCSFELPDDLEVQAGSWKTFNDLTAKNLGLEYQSDKLWLQQSGLNENKQGSRDSYIRISFKSMELPENTNMNPLKNPNLNQQDLADFDQMFDSEINNYKLAKILQIEKSVVGKIGKYYSVKKAFTSKMTDKPIKKSERHLIFSNSKGYLIELEYWQPDYKKYDSSINVVFNSLKLIQ